MSTTVPCSESHAWIDVSGQARNWTRDNADEPAPMMCRAFPMRQVADATNRALGRYPAPRMMMGWPLTSPTTTSADINGSAPLINWATPDYVRNARTGMVRIVTSLRSDNAAANSYAAMQHNASESSPVSTAATNAASNYCFELRYDVIPLSRGAESNAVREYGLSTYGGYQVLDIIHQDDELTFLPTNTATHDFCIPASASGAREVLSDLAEQVRSSFHRLRTRNQGFQVSWLAQANSNAYQYPTVTATTGIVVTSNAMVNLMNQSWNARNSDSPGIECMAQYCGRGLADVVPCTVRIFAEYNAAAPAGNAMINVVGPCDYATVNVPANVGLVYYAVNVGLNTTLNPLNVANGVNKVDIFGSVANSGTDTLIVRGVFAQTDYN
jgi:hypothetical protein